MSLLYRTLFSDGRPSLLSEVRGTFADWLESRSIDLAIPAAGAVADEANEVTAAEAHDGGLHAVRLALRENRAEEQWTTTITAVEDGNEQSVWIDVERVASDPYDRPPLVAVPGLVAAMLANGTAHVGPTILDVKPIVIEDDGVDELIHQLTDPGRRLPLVVVSRDRYATPELAFERGEELLKKIIGLAPVFLLEGQSTAALAAALGPELQVVGGTVRTYLPDLALPDRSPQRHPSIAGTVFASQTVAASTRIQRSLSQAAVTVHPPDVYRDRIVHLPGFPRHQEATKSEELFADLVGVEQERDQLAIALVSIKDEVEFSALQLDEAEAELDSAQARVRYLEARLRAAGDQSANEPTPPAAVPETAESCTEALGFARQYLSNLEIGDTDYFASVLDTYMKSPAWARKAWRALRALDDYGTLKMADLFTGDFLAYCAQNPLARTVIPTAWVALKESETTDNNPKYRGARTFPIPPEVDSHEEVYMRSHIKIEAGGRPAPRIHFYDDTSGPSGQIHVGYFGEHLLSDQTN